MKRTTTGLTLFELVAAIALMGFVAIGSGWWIRTSTQRASQTARALRHEAALEAVFAAITHDLVVGDLVADTEKAPRISAKPAALSIATRSRAAGVGAVVREYAHHTASNELTASERAIDTDASRGAAPAPHVALGDVLSFDASLDEKSRQLTVAITLQDGTWKTRHWVLP